ncbi:anti-sigma factor [Puteibacter caeruleilacunae]|nr:anti-sigma factor [Puteibacter caeruleilacunae]
MKITKILSVLLITSVALWSCDDSDNDLPMVGNLNLNISGLENLGPDYVYEGWIIVNGAALSSGKFVVNDNGELSHTSFIIQQELLESTSAFVLTIEPYPDNDPGPSSVHILGGDISGNSGSLSVSHGAALGSDFADAMGKYILATPTNGAGTDENSGVWFLDISSGSPAAGLDLPTLPDGWQYEGWVVVDGQPVTTGKFTMVDTADDADPFSGDQPGPSFPGEDFLMDAPVGLNFPLDLSGAKVVISIEPMPDNSEAPFLLKPLLGDVPANAADHTVYMMDNISGDTNPQGSVSITL